MDSPQCDLLAVGRVDHIDPRRLARSARLITHSPHSNSDAQTSSLL